jgi:hypothetical protein
VQNPWDSAHGCHKDKWLRYLGFKMTVVKTICSLFPKSRQGTLRKHVRIGVKRGSRTLQQCLCSARCWSLVLHCQEGLQPSLGREGGTQFLCAKLDSLLQSYGYTRRSNVSWDYGAGTLASQQPLEQRETGLPVAQSLMGPPSVLPLPSPIWLLAPSH